MATQMHTSSRQLEMKEIPVSLKLLLITGPLTISSFPEKFVSMGCASLKVIYVQ